MKVRRWAAVLVSAALLLVSVSASASAATQAARSPVSTQARMEQAVMLLQPYVARNSDGTFTLDVPAAALRRIGVYRADYEALRRSIAAVNVEISAGRMVSDSSGQVYPVGHDGQIVRPTANREGVDYYWWGYRIGLSSSTVNKILAILAGGGGAAQLVPALRQTILQYLGEALLSQIAAILALYGAALAWYNADGYGVYLYSTWGGGLGWITSQEP